MARSAAIAGQPIMVRSDEKLLIPATEAGWFCRQIFVSDGWGTLSEKCHGGKRLDLEKCSAVQ